MSGPLSDQLAAIRDRDKALYSSRSARDLVHQDRHILLKLLDEITLCRDNAIRAAERTDQPIEFHLDEQLRDGLAGIAEWEHPGEPDQAPDWLIDAIVRVVRPELARLTEQRDRLYDALSEVPSGEWDRGPLMPGFARTLWISGDRLQRWRDVLATTGRAERDGSGT